MFCFAISRVSSIFGIMCCKYTSMLGDVRMSLRIEASIGVRILLPKRTSNGLKPCDVVVLSR